MSFSYHKQRVQVWGILNFTPDSFSDGGELSTQDALESRLLNWTPYVDGFDIGAESTAPHNHPISAFEERSRLENRLRSILPHWPKELTLSLDSYHPETVEWFFDGVDKDIPCVWNDVSGKIDEEVIRLLKKFPHLRYVLNFNPVPDRSLTGRHMDYATEVPIEMPLIEFFKSNFELLLKHNLFSRVIADPCFGFAKNRSQNHQLLHQLPQLMESLACPQWMWGISRKSFLRFPPQPSPQNPDTREGLDALGLLWMGHALDKLMTPHTIIMRTHAPRFVHGLRFWEELQSTWNTSS